MGHGPCRLVRHGDRQRIGHSAPATLGALGSGATRTCQHKCGNIPCWCGGDQLTSWSPSALTRAVHAAVARASTVGSLLSPVARVRRIGLRGDIHSERRHARSSTVALAVLRLSELSAGRHRRHPAPDANNRLPVVGRLVLRPCLTGLAGEAAGQSALRANATRLAGPWLHQPSREEGGRARHAPELAGGGGSISEPPCIRHRRSLPGHGRIVHRNPALAARLTSGPRLGIVSVSKLLESQSQSPAMAGPPRFSQRPGWPRSHCHAR